MGSLEFKDLFTHDGTVYGDWRDEFHKNGCAVVKNVISPERAAYYRQKQIEWLQSFGRGFDPNDESTWTQEHLPVNFKGSMYFAYSSTHEKFVWEARTYVTDGSRSYLLPRILADRVHSEQGVIDVFSKLWGTDELLVSFDGMNIALPRQKDLKWSPWPHTDQSPERLGMQCVQGLLNYAPNGEKDGGLILMKGSSKLFNEFFQETRKQADHEDKPPEEENFKDLFIFSEDDVQWFKDHGCEQVKINMEPGDLVLWDSRTMHHACLPEGDQIRHVQYICMAPKKFAKAEDIEMKVQLFKDWQGTTHWPYCNLRVQGPPLRDGKLDPQNRDRPLEPPELTDRLLQLAGVKAY